MINSRKLMTGTFNCLYSSLSFILMAIFVCLLLVDVEHSVAGRPLKVQPANVHYSEVNPNLAVKATRQIRSAVLNSTKLWPGGYVWYIIDPIFTKPEKDRIIEAFNNFQQQTCIKFRKCNGCKHYLYLTIVDKCFSSVGMDETGPQNISLDKDCQAKGTIVHELGHAVGLQHEHQRPDRDEHITVNVTNVEDKYLSQFDIIWNMFNLTRFDNYSIMHYGNGSAFAKNNDSVLITFKKSNDTVREPFEKYGLSELDIEGLNLLYNCTTTNS